MFTLHVRRTLVVVLVCVVCLTTVSCNDTKTLQELDKLITMVEQQPDLWKATAEGTIEQLGKTGTALSKKVSGDLTSLVQVTLGDSQAAVDCAQDKLGIRFLQQLQALRKKYNPSAPDPVVFPVICTVSPHQIDQGSTQIVEFYGIRFKEYVKAGNSYGVEIQYADGSIPKTNFRQVIITTDYLLQINVVGADWSGLDQSRDPRLVLLWGDKQVIGDQSAIPVVIVPPPHLRTLYSIPFGMLAFVPGATSHTLQTSINPNASMPNGCALQAVQAIYQYDKPNFEFPPVDSVTLGSNGRQFSIELQRINPSDLRYLGVSLNLTNMTSTPLMVRVVYTVQEDSGVDCSVKNATMDNP